MHHARALARRGEQADDKHAGIVESGIDRTLETRLFPLQASWLGTRLVRAACRMQAVFADRELGMGYLVVATRVSGA